MQSIIEVMQSQLWFYLTTVGLVSLCVGSFLNVVIYRVPQKMSIIKPGSHCFSCKEQIEIKDNLPIIGYFIFRETPDLYTWIGASIIFIGIFIISYREMKLDKEIIRKRVDIKS